MEQSFSNPASTKSADLGLQDRFGDLAAPKIDTPKIDSSGVSAIDFEPLFTVKDLDPIFIPVIIDLIEQSIEKPTRKDLLPLRDGQVSLSEIITLKYSKPSLTAVLLVKGDPGQQITFMGHTHPGGELCLQLKGQTIEEQAGSGFSQDSARVVNPGTILSSGEGSSHSPKGILDEDGVYMALCIWPKGTKILS
ncbi:MAG: hypothetical protein KDD56_03385 [Bdellovibrionales bacterium]|nr:hypothetical protein [Bdellovibrionales bacterium]